MTGFLWSVSLVVALLWPSRTLSIFDGLPLNGAAEAIGFGVVVPTLWLIAPRFLDQALTRLGIVTLLAVKVAGSLLLPQEGFCARFQTTAPFHNRVLTIPIDEPRGVLRSWDVRADWRADVPGCTAVVDRPYANWSAFPVWFLNFTDFLDLPDRVGVRTPESARRLTVDVRGVITVPESGEFRVELGRDMTASGRIDSTDVSSAGGQDLRVPLAAGSRDVVLHFDLSADQWRFVPLWNGRDVFQAASVTTTRPGTIDRIAASCCRFAIVSIVVALLLGWSVSVITHYASEPTLLGWTVVASAALIWCAMTAWGERGAGLLLLGAVAVPLGRSQRNWRGAMMLVGIPWLAFFVVRALSQVGHVSMYSVDDWLAYQVAGYRIFMNGFWLEGGNRVFDYQPLYRWMTGLLHLVFGDSSVGEVYWDAASLLAGALVAFTIVGRVAGFRWALGAAAATLATFSTGTIWYFVGRGLSEIAAAGFAFSAALTILHAGKRWPLVATAGILAVLTFYARLNHLLFAASLAILWVPLDVPAAWPRMVRALRTLDFRPATLYLATLGVGVGLFALRTWWYTGFFSVLYGTSLKNNDTGLRLSTIASLDVWKRIAHSLSSLVWMNEPPSPDIRALLVVFGVILSVLALLQVPRLSGLPVSIAVVTVGAALSSFVAHTHAYPGRMSIHLVPLAVAMTVVAARSAFGIRVTDAQRDSLGRRAPA